MGLGNFFRRKPKELKMMHLGTVVDVGDPELRQRIKVTIPGVLEGDPENLPWCVRKGKYSRGRTQQIPKKGDQILITFRNEDIRFPEYGEEYITEKAEDIEVQNVLDPEESAKKKEGESKKKTFADYFADPDAYGSMDEGGNVQLMHPVMGQFTKCSVSEFVSRSVKSAGLISSGAGSFGMSCSGSQLQIHIGGFSLNLKDKPKDDSKAEEQLKDLPGSEFLDKISEKTSKLLDADKDAENSKDTFDGIIKWTGKIVAEILAIPDTPEAFANMAEDKLPESIKKRKEEGKKIIEEKLKIFENLLKRIPSELKDLYDIVMLVKDVYDLITHFDITKVVTILKKIFKWLTFSIRPYIKCYNTLVRFLKVVPACYNAIVEAAKYKAERLGIGLIVPNLTLPDFPDLPELPTFDEDDDA